MGQRGQSDWFLLVWHREQGYYLQKPYPIEEASTSIVRVPEHSGGVTVSELEGFPVRALVFDVGETHREAAEMVGAACEALQRQNTPFNLLISSSGSRIYLLPQVCTRDHKRQDWSSGFSCARCRWHVIAFLGASRDLSLAPGAGARASMPISSLVASTISSAGGLVRLSRPVQCFAERQAKGEVEPELLSTLVNPAVFEMAGHIIMKRREDFDSMTEEAADQLLAAASLSAPAFEEVKALFLEAAETCMRVQ